MKIVGYCLKDSMTINVYEVSMKDKYSMLLGTNIENSEWCNPYFEESKMESFVNFKGEKISLKEFQKI